MTKAVTLCAAAKVTLAPQPRPPVAAPERVLMMNMEATIVPKLTGADAK